MRFFSRHEIDELEKIYRLNLINSCSGYKSANLVATSSNEGVDNVAVFSSVVHLGSSPPLLGFVLRPTTVPRHTYSNIRESGFYTINHIHSDILADAHHTSAKYPADVSEFDQTNLKAEFKSDFYAPFVAGAPVQIAMRFIEEIEIKTNGVLMIVGEIIGIFLSEEMLSNDGSINLSKANVATISGLDAYSVPKDIEQRFSYQRPKT